MERQVPYASAMMRSRSGLRLSLPPTEGGAAVYRQQQDYSLAALAKRDAKEDPFGKEAPAAPPVAANDDAEAEREAAKMLAAVAKGLA